MLLLGNNNLFIVMIKYFLFIFMTLSISLYAQAKLIHNVKYVYYDVSPRGYPTLGKAAHAATPIRDAGETFLGNTNWYMRWDYTYTADSNECKVTSHIIMLDIVITLPRLLNATAQQQNEFTAFITKLDRHEKNHEAIALRAANQFDQFLNTLRRSTCAGLEAFIEQKGNAIMEDIRGKNKAYDQRTNHGITEGATLK